MALSSPGISFIGGARIGSFNATLPFARLSYQGGRLVLRCFGSFEFAPNEVVSLTRHGSIPILSRGLRINHNRADLPKNVVFWCAGNPDRVIRELAQAGFVASGEARAWPEGSAFRWSAIVTSIVIWNLLFLCDLGWPPALGRRPLGVGALTAVLLGFLAATLIKRSSRVQRWVLNPGHDVGEVRLVVTFLQLLLGLMFSVFAIVFSSARLFSP